MGKKGPWQCGGQPKMASLLCMANILFRLFIPIETFVITPTVLHHHDQYSKNFANKRHEIKQKTWISQQTPETLGKVRISHVLPNNNNNHNYYQNSIKFPSVPYYPKMQISSLQISPFTKKIKKKEGCNGRENLLQDMGVLAIVSGAVGTLMGIFSASYFSVVGNTISFISGIISYALGIPAAIITYLAASDRASYTLANILSVLSIANTAYSFLSVDFGNKDIFTSQVANVIGVFSLGLSIVTAFPELFDALLFDFAKKSPKKRREIYGFVRNYGCDVDKPTVYEYTQNIIQHLAGLNW